MRGKFQAFSHRKFLIARMSPIWDTDDGAKKDEMDSSSLLRSCARCYPRLARRGSKGTRLGSVLTRLQKGESIGMPDVRPMSSIGPHASEIRIPDRSGNYRALYVIQMEFGILLFHAFQKKSFKTPEKEKITAQSRLEAFLRELKEEK